MYLFKNMFYYDILCVTVHTIVIIGLVTIGEKCSYGNNMLMFMDLEVVFYPELLSDIPLGLCGKNF